MNSDPWAHEAARPVRARRKPGQKAEERRAWQERVAGDFRTALLALGDPRYVSSDQLNTALETLVLAVDPAARKRHWRSALEACGYVVMKANNPHGKHKYWGRWVWVYRRKEVPSINAALVTEMLDGRGER